MSRKCLALAIVRIPFWRLRRPARISEPVGSERLSGFRVAQFRDFAFYSMLSNARSQDCAHVMHASAHILQWA